MVLNPPKIIMINCYLDAYFVELWVHDNPQGLFFAKIRTGFVVIFAYLLYFRYQNYRQKMILIPYIMNVLRCHIILETSFPWKLLSRIWLKILKWIKIIWSLCQYLLFMRKIKAPQLWQNYKYNPHFKANLFQVSLVQSDCCKGIGYLIVRRTIFSDDSTGLSWYVLNTMGLKCWIQNRNCSANNTKTVSRKPRINREDKINIS